MDVFYLSFLILFTWCVCPGLTEHNISETEHDISETEHDTSETEHIISENSFYLDVLPENQILSNISDLVYKHLKEQDRRFDARIKEFEDRIMDIIGSLKPCLPAKTTEDTNRENVQLPNGIEQPNEYTCRDLNNTVIPEGTSYHPYIGDPCVFCMCRNGRPEECGTVMCAKPTCRDYTPIPGTCCEYYCDENQDNEIEVLPTAEPSDIITGKSCTIWNGTKIKEGETYVPYEGDPCHKCTCEDGLPAHCYSVSCQPPDCENYEQNLANCCEFTCLPDPGNVIQEESTGHCRDWNDTIIPEGDTYAPKRNDLCYKCECREGEPVNCYAVNCFRPECENFVKVEGACCEFTCLPPDDINEIQQDATDYRCTDRNGTLVSDGDLYAPDRDDPCLQCTCDSGYPIKCFTLECPRPDCEHFVQRQGTCCEFHCVAETSRVEQNFDRGCKDLNNTYIEEGETYYPYRDDPCIFCMCVAGYPVTCQSEECGKPSCSSYTPIVGTCCDYVCHEQTTGAISPNAEIKLDREDDQYYFCGELECRLEYHSQIVDSTSRCNISIGIKTVKTDGLIFYSKSSSNDSQYQMLLMVSGKVAFISDFGSGLIELTSQIKYNDNQWHTVMVYKNRNICRLFVDGEEVNFSISSGDIISHSEPHNFYIGSGSTDGISSNVKPYMGCLRQFHYNGEGVGVPTVVEGVELCWKAP